MNEVQEPNRMNSMPGEGGGAGGYSLNPLSEE